MSDIELTCKNTKCKGKLVSLYYKVGNRWKRVKNQKVCLKCGTVYSVSVTLNHGTGP